MHELSAFISVTGPLRSFATSQSHPSNWATRRLCIAAQEPPFFPAVRERSSDLLQKYKLSLRNLTWDPATSLLTTYVAPLDKGGSATADELAQLSSDLTMLFDQEGIIPSENYGLEVSTQGVSRQLTDDMHFKAFRGFQVQVLLKNEFKKKKQYEGLLVERTDDALRISLRGRVVQLPRSDVETVTLQKAAKLE